MKFDKAAFLPLACVLAMSASAVVQAQAQVQNPAKIGFVNLDRILREAPAAQRAQKKIEQEFSKRDQDLAKMAEQLKKMQENLEANAMTMSETDRQKREREFNDMNRDFQRKQREFKEELNQRKQEEFSAIVERANKAVRSIAEAEKFDAIFQDAVYVHPRADITEKVIKVMDDSRGAKQ